MRVLSFVPLLAALACARQGTVASPQIPNPASVNCERLGGTLTIVNTPEGQVGMCTLPSGLQCEEWALFRGECPCGSCPVLVPPAPGFCEDGTLVPGPIDACGCQGPPVCDRPSPISVQLESLYLDDGFRVGRNAAARTVSLTLSGRSDDALGGTLLLDPNTCSLNAFGDPEICTLIGVFGIEVDLEPMTLQDPTGRMRQIYQVRGRGLPQDLRMIVQGRLEADELERAYLKLGTELVPLFVEDGV